jgi:hypothetical protein
MHRPTQTLEAPAAPALPIPPAAYSSRTQGEHNRTLKGYFERISNALRALFGHAGGQYIDNPNGLFFHIADQTLAAANTGYPVQFGQTYLANHVAIADGSKITAEVAGVYNFQYSGSVESTNSSAKNIYLWIRRNGVDLGYTTNGYTFSGSGTLGVIAWNFSIDLAAGDYIELVWAANDVNVTLQHVTPTAPHTGIPASVCAVLYVAPMPDPRPTPPAA